MFFEEGWVPLSEVTAEVFRQLQALQAEGHVGTGEGAMRSMLAISVWEICDACTKIAVTTENGSVIWASHDLLSWADPRALSNEHVDLRVGSVGSSKLPDEDGAAPTREAMVSRYGPFLNLPLVLPVNNFQSSMTFLAEEVKNYNPRDPEIINAAKAILELTKTGLATREIARAKLGAALSRRKFKIAWGLAAQHLPELAAPNRWAGL